MAQLVTADPRLSWWKERTNSTQLTSDLYPCAQNKQKCNTKPFKWFLINT